MWSIHPLSDFPTRNVAEIQGKERETGVAKQIIVALLLGCLNAKGVERPMLSTRVE